LSRSLPRLAMLIVASNGKVLPSEKLDEVMFAKIASGDNHRTGATPCGRPRYIAWNPVYRRSDRRGPESGSESAGQRDRDHRLSQSCAEIETKTWKPPSPAASVPGTKMGRTRGGRRGKTGERSL
jgi:hypothetical protein